QLNKILAILGLPKDISFWDPSEAVLEHIHSICTTDGRPPPTESIDFQALFPTCSPEGIDMLESLLQLDPVERMTVEEAITHPYLRSFSDPVEESMVPPASIPHQFEFENSNNDSELKDMVIQYIQSFKQQKEENMDV
ncbi:hypothetical protein ABG067_008848, partial [Albugo candida]